MSDFTGAPRAVPRSVDGHEQPFQPQRVPRRAFLAAGAFFAGAAVAHAPVADGFSRKSAHAGLQGSDVNMAAGLLRRFDHREPPTHPARIGRLAPTAFQHTVGNFRELASKARINGLTSPDVTPLLEKLFRARSAGSAFEIARRHMHRVYGIALKCDDVYLAPGALSTDKTDELNAKVVKLDLARIVAGSAVTTRDVMQLSGVKEIYLSVDAAADCGSRVAGSVAGCVPAPTLLELGRSRRIILNKAMRDMSVLFHEVGHHLDFKFEIGRSLEARYPMAWKYEPGGS